MKSTRIFLKKKKDKRCQYAQKQYRNLSEEENEKKYELDKNLLEDEYRAKFSRM